MADWDVIVVGTGNAGLAAATASREAGAERVLALEKAPLQWRGGNTRCAGGMLRIAFDDPEELVALYPALPDMLPQFREAIAPYPAADYLADLQRLTSGRSDPMLSYKLVSQSRDVVQWMVGHGIALELAKDLVAVRDSNGWRFPPGPVLRVAGGDGALAQAWFEIAERAGVTVRYAAPVVDLVDDDTNIVGVRTGGTNAGIHGAAAVILACGGFEANPEMRARYLGAPWDSAKVRGTRYNTGDGLRMAMSHGALTHGHWSGCHACPIDGQSPDFGDGMPAEGLIRLSFHLGILVNRAGRRFVDEGVDFPLNAYAQLGRDVLAQPGGYAYQLFDGRALPHLSAHYLDADCIEAPDLPTLIAALEVDPDACRHTVEEYNQATRGNLWTLGKLDRVASRGIAAPKSNWAQPLERAPFRAYRVTGGITFTYGGLRIDERARVLSCDWTPLPGLYACGELVGGLFYGNYPGGSGLVSGAVFGRIAGAAAER